MNSATLPGVPAQPGLAAVRGLDLVRVYGSGDEAVRALDRVTVEFPSGRSTAIMGPSGSYGGGPGGGGFSPQLAASIARLVKASASTALAVFSALLTQLLIFLIAGVIAGVVARLGPARRTAHLQVMQALAME